MPIWQPPGSDDNAPPSQLVTDSEPSAPTALSLKGRPLIFSTAAIGNPSLSPFGAAHLDCPLIEITRVSLRAVSFCQSTSRRRLGSRGNTTVAFTLPPSWASTSV